MRTPYQAVALTRAPVALPVTPADDPPRSDTRVCRNALSVGAPLALPLVAVPELALDAGLSALTSDWKSDCSLDNSLLGEGRALALAGAAEAAVLVLGVVPAPAPAAVLLAAVVAVPEEDAARELTSPCSFCARLPPPPLLP